MKNCTFGIIAGLFLLACNNPKTIENDKMDIKWDTLAVIPPANEMTIQYGLAGPVTGAYGNEPIVGGGSNFEDAMPWMGGTKKYHNLVYVLHQKKDGLYKWSKTSRKLLTPIAYSACISTNKGILSIGGETANNPIDQVFLLSVQNKKLQFSNFPALPVALSNSGAAMIDSVVFLAGGLDSIGATSYFFALDLKKIAAGWKLLPELPVSLSHAVVIAQSDGIEECIYVLGGRTRTGVISTFLSAIWKFSQSKNKWEQVGQLQLEDEDVFGFATGTGLAYQDRYILLFGGDKGIIFNETERLIDASLHAKTMGKREKAQKQKVHNMINHPGFCKDVYLFNTITGKLKKIGELPGMTQVTTHAFWWNGQIIIPGGEIRPGVRSSLITRGKII
ncbi:MAG: hypothetical protein WCS30_13820, partial [Selenomonadaceae bacterium]